MLYPCKNAFLFLLKYLFAILPYFGEGYNVEFSGEQPSAREGTGDVTELAVVGKRAE